MFRLHLIFLRICFLAVFLAILFSASHVLLAFGAVLCMLNKNDYMGMCTSVFSTF